MGINKQTAKKFNHDFFTVADVNENLTSSFGLVKDADEVKGLALFDIGVGAMYMAKFAESFSGKDLALAHGTSGGTVTNGLTVSRVARHASAWSGDEVGEYGGNVDRLPTMAIDMERYWNFAHDDVSDPLHGCFVTYCRVLSSEGSELNVRLQSEDRTITRLQAYQAFADTFGSVNGAYAVANSAFSKNPRYHNDDPRSTEGQDEGQEDGQEEDGSNGHQSWQEMVAEATRRATEAGASLSEIVALVREVHGS